jgi:hypothetical protein
VKKEVKEALLQELREGDSYPSSLIDVKDAAERRQIRAFVEDVYLNLIEGVLNIDSALEQNLVEPEDEQIPSE